MIKESEKQETQRLDTIDFDFLRKTPDNPIKSPQSNPSFKTLLRLVHTELIKNKQDYKSFSRV